MAEGSYTCSVCKESDIPEEYRTSNWSNKLLCPVCDMYAWEAARDKAISHIVHTGIPVGWRSPLLCIGGVERSGDYPTKDLGIDTRPNWKGEQDPQDPRWYALIQEAERRHLRESLQLASR